MNTKIKILATILFSLIYCYTITFTTKSIIEYDLKECLNTQEEQYFSTITTNFLAIQYQSENNANTFKNLSYSNLKNTSSPFFVIINIQEQIVKSSIFQYIKLSTNFLIQYRKKDLLFPFQYFW